MSLNRHTVLFHYLIKHHQLSSTSNIFHTDKKDIKERRYLVTTYFREEDDVSGRWRTLAKSRSH